MSENLLKSVLSAVLCKRARGSQGTKVRGTRVMLYLLIRQLIKSHDDGDPFVRVEAPFFHSIEVKALKGLKNTQTHP